jgi:DNA repair exonuclease SbcCD ATPase subunit
VSDQALTGRLLPQADAPPVVRLRQPQRDLRLAAPPVAALEVAASDDFGLTGLALEYRVGAGGAWQRQELGAAGRTVRLDYDWDLGPLNLRPGQSVWCRFAARDNDTVSGPHVAYSTTRRFTLADPRPRQAAARVQQAQAAERETLEQLQEEAREIARELAELQERVSNGEVRPGDATARATAEQAAQRQERLGQKVQQAVAEARQQLQEAGALTPEVQQRLSDLNQALRQALEQQLPRVVAQLRKLAQATPNQKWPQDLQAAREAQEELQRQLEQLAALLKQAQLETSLGQLRQDVQKLLARQQALDKERAGADRAELRQQAERQQQLGRDTRDLPARLEQVAAQSREAAPQLEQRLRELSAQTRQADPAGKMDRAAGQLRQGQSADAGQSQAGAMQDLQQLAGQLAGTQADVYARQRQELQQAVGRIMRDALYLSRQQERVLADTEPLAGQSRQETVQAKPQLQRLQQRQETVTKGLDGLQQRLGDLSRQTPLLDPRLVAGAQQLTAQAAQAAREVAGGAPTEAAADQREVMAGLNQLVQQFLDAQQSYQQASAQMAWQETLKRLEQMAQQQAGLNQMTQQMGSSGQPRPGPGAGELADQQAALRQALQQMLGQSGEGSGLGQQLGGVPAQMNDVAQALEGRRVTADTHRTQAQILHKLLDAQRSLYRQDRQDRQRRAEAPKPYRPPASPPQLRASVRPSRLTPPAPPPREWPLGYEDLTRRYFEAVGRGETIGR